MASPILSYYLYLYTFLGFRMTPISWRTLWLTLWCPLHLLLLTYAYLYTDPYKITERFDNTYTDKALITLLYENNISIYIVSSFAIQVYYTLFGSTLVHHLRSPILEQIYQTASLPIGVLPFLFNTLIFLVGFHNVMIQTLYDAALPLPFKALNFLVYFLTYSYFAVTFLILQYVQYGLHLHLSYIYLNVDQLSGRAIIQQISAFAKLNQTIQFLNSIPLMLYFWGNTFDYILNVSISGFYLQPTFLFYISLSFGYLLWVFYQGQANQVLLVKVSNKYTKNGRPRTSKDFILKGITLYSDYFHLNLFSICCLDISLLFALILFILNYSVLIFQTKK